MSAFERENRESGSGAHLDDREERDDESGEGAVADDVVPLCVVDAVEREGEDGSSGDVALAAAEGVADRGEGEEGLGRDDEDAAENRRVRVVVAAAKMGGDWKSVSARWSGRLPASLPRLTE